MAKVDLKRLGVTTGVLFAIAGALYGYALIKDYSENQGELNAVASEVGELRKEAQKAGLWIELSAVQTEQRVRELEQFSDFEVFDQLLKDNPEFADSLTYIDDRQYFAERLSSLPEAIDALYYVADLDGVSFPIEWEKGLLAPSIDHTIVNRLVNFATSSAIVALEQGEEEEAWRRLRAGVKVMNHLKEEPVSDSVLGWSSASAKILRALYRIIENDPTNALSVRNSLALIEEIGDPLPFDDFLSGDALKFFITSRDFDEYSDDEVKALKVTGDEYDPVPEGRNRPEAFEAASLAFWTSAIDEIKDIDNVIEKGIRLDRLGIAWAEDERPSQFIAIAFPVTYEQIGTQIARSKQMRRMLYLVCMHVSEWQATGSFPSTLLESSEWSIDPVMEAPFFYETIDDGFRLQAMGMAKMESLMLPRGDLTWIHGQGYSLEFTVSN